MATDLGAKWGECLDLQIQDDNEQTQRGGRIILVLIHSTWPSGKGRGICVTSETSVGCQGPGKRPAYCLVAANVAPRVLRLLGQRVITGVIELLLQESCG